jgi:sirohydrochlorin ferrochelatase
MTRVAEAIRQARPQLDVRIAFLDLNVPSVPQVVDAVAAEGHRAAIVVPLLLGSAFHARTDLPGLLATARARHPRLSLVQAEVLGPDPRLVSAMRDRLVEADIDPHDPGVGVAVAAVGSSVTAANARTSTVAAALAAGTAWQAEPCFATCTPSVSEATAALRTGGAERVVVAPWFLAPGLLIDRLAVAGLPVVDAIGAHPLLTAVAVERYDTAIATPLVIPA